MGREQFSGIPPAPCFLTSRSDAFRLFVPVIKRLSPATVGEPYTDEASAMLDAGSRTISVPVSGAVCFYRLRAGTALTISHVSVSGGTIIIAQ